VWATLKLSVNGATLRIFDAAPDAHQRVCLAEHTFPLRRYRKTPNLHACWQELDIKSEHSFHLHLIFLDLNRANSQRSKINLSTGMVD
jgi:hypothetical protein